MSALVEGSILAVLRGVPVPARCARHADLGARHPAVGDPDLRGHAVAGLHAQLDQPAGAVAGRRRAGRRCHRRDREHRAPHAHGQERLPGGARRRRPDRPRGGGLLGDHHRGVPAGELHGRHHRAVLQAVRPDGGRGGVLLAAGGAPHHPGDRRLHPQVRPGRRAQRRPDHGLVPAAAALVHRCTAGRPSSAAWPSSLSRSSD